MLEWYNLEGDTPVPVPKEKVNWDHRWNIKTAVNDFLISTAFIPYNLGVGNEPRALFETLIFGGPLGRECQKYSTKAEAEEGHNKWVQRALKASHDKD